ncbi:MAG: peptidase M18 aminopeptidase I [Halanaerobium sp. 4-GBenrich]|jgi:aspartyl aminopeptidase|uniref:M18 family aminopeptidase n=1 Tax=Halanaerobium congolense TaxID=54121 RepID=A0A1G6IZW3_9FIRM|nr:aminopeptidase [Halanaerobium congolense]KXS49819.1 MAG: peptidase M18 aminopeptidase I [Halanaerobium sp. T82-1]ODS50468.1 MAG: peptidase M18 aminopeptidase I [Halanaerobium sp. 4-GBenrich]PUU91723.1 MAG: peptidase M18 aminopeptidase I [Halanaerobium sp.]PTX15841.1 aspartyl aminopeptidase [Halanaerobium congolense]PXV70086.1 aspartyl aminopeptidase [Halanaerobium congolense]
MTKDQKNNNLYQAKNAWTEMEEVERNEVFAFNEKYAKFLTENKTEREFASAAVVELEAAGFKNINEYEKLEKGDKFYVENRSRALLAAVIGEKDLKEGLKIVGSHIDSPRLDLKPNPLYEDGEMAMFKTHYYGGVKKYQWVTMPLALHGVVVKDDGSQIEIKIGEKEEDPVFFISDVLPHLGKKQMKKSMTEGISGEQLNVVVGSIPVADEEAKDKIKTAVLNHLQAEYDFKEEDFISADLQIVPAFKTRDAGFDRALLAGYGHDDRVCSYTALEAILDVQNPEYTSVLLLMDREEVGSMGSTGMQSHFFEDQVANLVDLYYDDYSELIVRKVMQNSKVLSADVSAAYDPDFAEVYAKHNSAYLGKGIVVSKYTGARGKAGASEASAEFMGEIRGIFNKAGVIWQTAELGKIDEGGGGTIAQFLANYNMDVVDCGPAVLSMHSPYEVVSKADVYHSYLAYNVFLEK